MTRRTRINFKTNNGKEMFSPPLQGNLILRMVLEIVFISLLNLNLDFKIYRDPLFVPLTFWFTVPDSHSLPIHQIVPAGIHSTSQPMTEGLKRSSESTEPNTSHNSPRKSLLPCHHTDFSFRIFFEPGSKITSLSSIYLISTS